MYVNKIRPGLLLQNVVRQNGDSNNQSNTDNAAAASTESRKGAGQNELQTVLAHIDYVKQQLDTMLKSYPPFFPVGSPQRMDWINKIRDVQDEVGNIAGEAGMTAMKQRIDKNASDDQISAAIKGLMDFRKEVGGKGLLSIKI